MAKLDTDWNPGVACLPLSTGDFALIPGDTIIDEIISADTVMSKIAMAHIDEILEVYVPPKGGLALMEIISKEVDYVIEHGVKDPAGALHWFLTMLAVQRSVEFVNMYKKARNQGEDQ